MADLPFTPAAGGLAARLDACLDVEEKIPRALDALGPVTGRDVVLVDTDGGRRAGQLAQLGARVRSLPAIAPGERLDADDGSADVVVGFWSTFRAPSGAELAEADRVLRPGGRLLVVHDYGRDDVSRLRGDLPEYGMWSRRDGWYLTNGFRVRVIHCFWTFDSIDEARAFLGEAFGEVGEWVGATLKRPRLSYNVAIYHRTRGGAEPTA
ncbi:MAG: class I SAM-dependent methyltransferase [Candidatus Limnocylindrales bacterium]